MPRSRRYHRSRGQASTAGQKAARRHIEEARQFEKEMGGTVSDVKKYFFGLKDAELNAVFAAYSLRYGAAKEEYARQAFSRWKSSSTQMSGLVAKRLFTLLPAENAASDKNLNWPATYGVISAQPPRITLRSARTPILSSSWTESMKR